MTAITAGQLAVNIYENRQALGQAAATMAAQQIKELLQQQPVVNIIFAAAGSQLEFLAALIREDLEWNRVQAFHMDEYMGLPDGHPQLFSNFLREKIFGKVSFKNIFYINGQATDIHTECSRYAALLKTNPVDITFMGIGENAHLAFNDPHVALFNDSKLVKIVDLDEACKQQQVNEGCFSQPAEVPPYAYTLTIPALLNAKYIYCMVPGATKAQAVYHTLKNDISEKYPSTILREHENTTMFLDKESAALII